MGFGALSLAGLLGEAAEAGEARRLPHHAPTAKRAIFLFMNGGPSHVDTFDPKPALKQYEGQQPSGELYKKSKGTGFMPSPFTFSRRGSSGIEVSESLPALAECSDVTALSQESHAGIQPAVLHQLPHAREVRSRPRYVEVPARLGQTGRCETLNGVSRSLLRL